MLAPRWRHTLQQGTIESEVVCADGRVLHSRALDGVLCRLRHAPAPLFAASPTRDRDYAVMEGYALLMSWLASLPCPVINPAGSRGLCGPGLGFVEWLALGARSGLRPRGFRLDTPSGHPPGEGWAPHRLQTQTATTLALEPVSRPAADRPAVWLAPVAAPPVEALAVGDRVIGAPDDGLVASCLEVARRSSCPVLALHFAPDPVDGEPLLCGAEPCPALESRAAAAVADLLIDVS